jgi:hypothetical protein
MPELFMVFDCESIGLHGETFAVGWVVVNRGGEQLACGRHWCNPDDVAGEDEGRRWIGANVPLPFGTPACPGPRDIRDRFWDAWQHWREEGAMLAADCAWPVEARFLAACVDGDPSSRTWTGPYPLIDVASVRLAAGLDPLATEERLPSEMPSHDPLADACQSARLLIQAMEIVGNV